MLITCLWPTCSWCEEASAATTVSAHELARKIRGHGGQVADVHQADDIERYLRSSLRTGDVLVTMGAGDIGKIAHGIVERF